MQRGPVTASASTIMLSAAGTVTVGADPTNNTIAARGGDSGISGTGGNGAVVSIAAGGLVTIGATPGAGGYVSVFTRGGGAANGNGGYGVLLRSPLGPLRQAARYSLVVAIPVSAEAAGTVGPSP